jgi:hypothetical protein
MVALSFVITVLILQKHLQASLWKNDSDKCLSINQDRHEVLGYFCIFLLKTLYLLSANTLQKFKGLGISPMG